MMSDSIAVKPQLIHSNYFIYLALFFNFFPWLSFSLNNFDTQPWFIVLNTFVVLFFFDKKFPLFVYVGYFFLPFIALLVLNDFNFYSIRGFFSYYALFVSMHFFYIIFKYYPGVFIKSIIFSNVIWVTFPFFQYFFCVDVFNFLVHARTTADRGVTSFSVEPTQFAIHLVFFTWIIALLSNLGLLKTKTALFIGFVNFICVLFVAKSTMGFFYFSIFIAFYIFIYGRGRVGFLFFVLFFSLTSFVLFINSFPDYRLAKMFFIFVEDPYRVFQIDASINARISHFVLPVYGSFLSFFFPNGFNDYYIESVSLNANLNNLFWYGYQSRIIMSGIGSMFYEIGFVSILLLLYVLYVMMGAKYSKVGFLSFALLFIFLIGSVPLSYPLLSIVIILVYFNRKVYLRPV